MILITSKRHNFRRCGAAHPKDPVEYPGDRFTANELEILKAEPMLKVEIIPVSSAGSGQAEILEAAKKVIEAGDVTNSGKPKVEAIEAILGRNISAADRDEVFEKLTAEG